MESSENGSRTVVKGSTALPPCSGRFICCIFFYYFLFRFYVLPFLCTSTALPPCSGRFCFYFLNFLFWFCFVLVFIFATFVHKPSSASLLRSFVFCLQLFCPILKFLVSPLISNNLPKSPKAVQTHTPTRILVSTGVTFTLFFSIYI